MANMKRGIDAYRKTLKASEEKAADEKRPKKPVSEDASAAENKIEGLLRTAGENPYRKAAKLLMLLGKEEAGKVLRHFSDEEVEAISREIAEIRRIEPVEADRLLAEVGFLKESRPFPVGGVETARRMLVNAFGEEKGRSILARSVPPEQRKLFDFLEDLEPNQIHHLLREESPAVLSVILPISARKRPRGFSSSSSPGSGRNS